MGKKYPVLCAWCQAEGKERVINYSECEDSHGICEEHQAGLYLEIEQYKKQTDAMRHEGIGS